MRVAALFSGGKDSTFSVYRAIQQGRDIACLIAMKSANPASYMFHVPNIDIVKLQSRALGIRLIFKRTAGVKEEELKDLKSALTAAKKLYKIQGVVSGAIASEYQRYRVEAVCADLGLKSLAPLWHLDPERYLVELIREGFEIIFSSVASDGFDSSWLGRKLDMQALEDLKRLRDKYGMHIGGEGGEYETLVLDGPIFNKKIVIQKSENQWKGDSGFFIVKKAKLASKGKK